MGFLLCVALNESPSEKEGKSAAFVARNLWETTLNESPSEKEGKYVTVREVTVYLPALNESPSEKEGKFQRKPIPPLPPAGPQ